MERSPVLLDQVLEYLRAHGYPEDAFALEWPVSKNHRADLAVIDSTSGRPIALVELKATSNEASLRLGRTQLQRLYQLLGRDVLLFLAYPGEGAGPPQFERVQPTSASADSVVAAELPEFTIAQSSHRTKEQASIAKERDRSFDKFAVTCWVSAGAIAALGLLDHQGYIAMTAERLTLLGIAVGLLILPFAKRLKFLGWEFHRLRGHPEEDKD